MHFYLTRRARADLIDIARYTETQFGKSQRDRYLARLDEAFHDLTEMPERGPSCDDIRQGYRKLLVGKHLVFYRCVAGDELEIVRILHGSMDVKSRLFE